jgi:cytochrome c oxidase subunit IV
MKFLPTLTKEKLLVYFLLLWAASFFLWAIYDLVDFGPMSAQAAFSLLGALCDLAAGAVLALFSWKLLANKDQTLPPPP